MASWQPLSKRGTESPHEDALYEGVPVHLKRSLLYWLDSLFAQQEGRMHKDEDFIAVERRAARIAARLRLDLQSVSDAQAQPRFLPISRRRSASVALVHLAGEADDAVLLGVIDATLADGVQESDTRA